MGSRESFMDRLEEIEREYEVRLRGAEWVQSRLRWEDWESLREEAVVFARQEIRRHKCRGARGGVVPGGCGAEDVADESIRELLEGHCWLVMGFMKKRLVSELQRLVSQRVRVLKGLKETAVMRSEWDAAPLEEGAAPVSVFDGLSAGGSGENNEEKEEMRELLRKEIEVFLGAEPELKKVFGYLWSGIRNAAEIGRRLGM